MKDYFAVKRNPFFFFFPPFPGKEKKDDFFFSLNKIKSCFMANPSYAFSLPLRVSDDLLFTQISDIFFHSCQKNV